MPPQRIEWAAIRSYRNPGDLQGGKGLPQRLEPPLCLGRIVLSVAFITGVDDGGLFREHVRKAGRADSRQFEFPRIDQLKISHLVMPTKWT
jgi:hypothetical protein